MNKSLLRQFLAALCLILATTACAAGGGEKSAGPGGPKLGAAAAGPGLDKSGDATLQKLIADVAPKFAVDQYKYDKGVIDYNLFAPANIKPGQKYPLVLFIADASTPGKSVAAPLTQGYGSLVFATPEAQKKHPCYVLVPQLSGVGVNDAYEHTPEVDGVMQLLNHVAKNNAVDSSRIYVTGQSMGGMMGMYYNSAYPDVFAAALYVDCHWDTSNLPQLLKKPFIFVYAGNSGKSWQFEQAIEEAARKERVSYAWSEWSAKLPQKEQDALAQTVLDKGQPINLIGFESGTVLPDNGKGSEHMNSFDYAYRLAPVRDWLFKHKLAN